MSERLRTHAAGSNLDRFRMLFLIFLSFCACTLRVSEAPSDREKDLRIVEVDTADTDREETSLPHLGLRKGEER